MSSVGIRRVAVDCVFNLYIEKNKKFPITSSSLDNLQKMLLIMFQNIAFVVLQCCLLIGFRIYANMIITVQYIPVSGCSLSGNGGEIM